jgi:hypothetical protein
LPKLHNRLLPAELRLKQLRQQAQKQAQDPIIQMQQQELQIKAAEHSTQSGQKDQIDASTQQQQQKLKQTDRSPNTDSRSRSYGSRYRTHGGTQAAAEMRDGRKNGKLCALVRSWPSSSQAKHTKKKYSNKPKDNKWMHLEVIVQQTDDKVSELKNFLADGRCESFEDYKRICGEIRGLLIARGYILDLKQNLEIADE